MSLKHIVTRGGIAVVAASALLAARCASLASADTFLSGFEGDLSSSLGVNWEFYDTDDQTPGDQLWSTQFVTTGATQGTSALEVTHPADAWQHGMRLNTGALAPLIASHDKLEFDATASPDATWRGVWVIMQGDGLDWSQAQQVDLIPGQTVHVVIDLSLPDAAAPAKNWKASAAASGGTWWQLTIAMMGGDAASVETTTTFDNFRLTAAIPSSPADFDDDGDVDGDDLVQWKASFGVDALADADGDLITDGNDFLIWQREFTPPAAASAIPEPSSVALALLAMSGVAVSRVRKRRN